MIEKTIYRRDKFAIAGIILLFITIIYSNVTLNKEISKLEKKIETSDSLYNDMYYGVFDTFEKQSFIVTVTTWNPTKAQTDDSPNLTACGFRIDTINPYKQRIVGLSRDLLEHFYYGEKVIIENCGRFNGVYTVVDCGAKRLVRTVDICIGRNQLGGKFENVIIRHYKSKEDD
jgi:hypothetical protein